MMVERRVGIDQERQDVIVMHVAAKFADISPSGVAVHNVAPSMIRCRACRQSRTGDDRPGLAPMIFATCFSLRARLINDAHSCRDSVA